MMMTNEKAIKVLKGTLSLLHQTNINFDDVSDYREASNTAIYALEKQEKYKWHDLRKNPDDLPKVEDINKEYLLYSELTCSSYVIYRGWYIKACIEDGKWFCDAWKEIEPFEEDEHDLD